jgi:hypothetical protein
MGLKIRKVERPRHSQQGHPQYYPAVAVFLVLGDRLRGVLAAIGLPVDFSLSCCGAVSKRLNP